MSKVWKKHEIVRCHHCLGVLQTYTDEDLPAGARETFDKVRCMGCDRAGYIDVDDDDNEGIWWEP